MKLEVDFGIVPSSAHKLPTFSFKGQESELNCVNIVDAQTSHACSLKRGAGGFEMYDDRFPHGFLEFPIIQSVAFEPLGFAFVHLCRRIIFEFVQPLL